ncbi:uncharacterized protein LOC113495853 [Trichoplusia ni]|uniref:Uncharacterized protein LOC113495853 n=1 Tax=Trichoplusia ni TaxID=7111 RepID=A0A7E5VQN3_TRINI|nr:uncharacterized protein LOC113495853 [Trichoplusia ni]
MFKFTCLLLCSVVASLSGVSATISDKDKEVIREAVGPFIKECSQGHDDETGSCFVGCFFNKMGIVDASGVYNVDVALTTINAHLKTSSNLSRFEEISKICKHVNGKSVSKGNEVCERAQLVLACALEHKSIATQYKFMSEIVFST